MLALLMDIHTSNQYDSPISTTRHRPLHIIRQHEKIFHFSFSSGPYKLSCDFEKYQIIELDVFC